MAPETQEFPLMAMLDDFDMPASRPPVPAMPRQLELALAEPVRADDGTSQFLFQTEEMRISNGLLGII